MWSARLLRTQCGSDDHHFSPDSGGGGYFRQYSCSNMTMLSSGTEMTFSRLKMYVVSRLRSGEPRPEEPSLLLSDSQSMIGRTPTSLRRCGIGGSDF